MRSNADATLSRNEPARSQDEPTGNASKTTFTVTLVAKPGQEGIRALRGFLKLALRRFGLRCVDAREMAAPDYDATDDFARSIDEAYRSIRERMAKGGPGWQQKEYRPK